MLTTRRRKRLLSPYVSAGLRVMAKSKYYVALNPTKYAGRQQGGTMGLRNAKRFSDIAHSIALLLVEGGIMALPSHPAI